MAMNHSPMLYLHMLPKHANVGDMIIANHISGDMTWVCTEHNEESVWTRVGDGIAMTSEEVKEFFPKRSAASLFLAGVFQEEQAWLASEYERLTGKP